MPILFCNIGWMSAYRGLEGQPDKIVNGGSHINEEGWGHEVCNFLQASDGRVYGHVETIKDHRDRSMDISKLGASVDQDFIDGVTVLWTATPSSGGTRVVGWYKNARVHRNRQTHNRMPSAQHKADGIDTFIIVALGKDATLLSLDERNNADLRLKRQSKGWMGHTPWWFPDLSISEVAQFVERCNAAIDGAQSRGFRTGWKGTKDPQRNAEVERRAVDMVCDYFNNTFDDAVVKSVEGDNLGWDLEVLRKGNLVRQLEVKGLSGSDAKVGLTPNEFEAFAAHISGQRPDYRLCVVTEALSKQARLLILRYDGQSWVDEVTNQRPKLLTKPIQSAIISVTS